VKFRIGRFLCLIIKQNPRVNKRKGKARLVLNVAKSVVDRKKTSVWVNPLVVVVGLNVNGFPMTY
jgi:hypothetical protein